jgi:intracellular sulfur oxidation DsrE/DsrF family protein
MNNQTLIVFTRFGMGEAPAELQLKLITNFLTLVSQDTPPGALAFYGEGVKLTCTGSPVLEQVAAIVAQGVPLIICRTCVDYFGLREAVQVGKVGTMADIVDLMGHAAKVITV